MEIKSFAKINLFLRITGRRPDGYHTLFTLMTCVDLADTIRLDLNCDNIRVDCPHPRVPEDETNLACRAAEAFYRHSAIKKGVDIRIDKHIPVAAGLGGGSSNAASVLTGLNRLHDFPLSNVKLMEIAAAIGADVPFFLMGSPALAEGIGERLIPYRLLKPQPVVLVTPDISVSTAEVYKSFNLGLTNNKKTFNNLSFTERTGFYAGKHLENDLESVTLDWYPELKQIKENLRAQGAVGSLMSGSGPTVFGLFPDTKTAEAACQTVAGDAVGRVILTKILAG